MFLASADRHLCESHATEYLSFSWMLAVSFLSPRLIHGSNFTFFSVFNPLQQRLRLSSLGSHDVCVAAGFGSDCSKFSGVADGRCLSLGVVELKVGTDDCPLNALEERIDVGLLAATILLQVGVLPEIDATNGHALHVHYAVHQRVVLVVSLSDQEPALVSDAKPDPSRQRSAVNGSPERLLKALKVGKVLSDRVRKRAQRLVQ